MTFFSLRLFEVARILLYRCCRVFKLKLLILLSSGNIFFSNMKSLAHWEVC